MNILQIIKTIMTLGDIAAGYKTYAVAFFGFTGALTAWGNGLVIPWMDGDMSVIELVSQSGQYFVMMSAAFATATIKAGIDRPKK